MRKGSGVHEIGAHSGPEAEVKVIWRRVKRPAVYPGVCIGMRRKQRTMGFEEDRNGFVFLRLNRVGTCKYAGSE